MGSVVAGLALLIGVILIVKRKAFSKFIEDSQRSTFGQVGTRLMGRPEPVYVVVVGLCAVLIGVAIAIVLLTR
ncbi:hypothetical protein [Arthrobacter sp. 9AX]|uniref:hypothetical protein n=1 Tax=Arthrobacter sp. 9AX TaxID=2653131 RepID=UPI001357AA2F|nr:hypothetical protein [Arthrobacter sp. 9AX]